MSALALGELPEGASLGDYRLDALVARGGMGVVYKAHQMSADRAVALKVIAPLYADDAAYRRRFEAEARAAIQIEHPNIVPVYGAGAIDGLLYIAMRFIEGRDLRRVIEAEGPLDAQRAVLLIGQIANGLDAAHGKGLVHRDVKPANVMVQQAGPGREHCYVLDFGLAKYSDSPSLTRTGKVMGTPAYLAPEQLVGGHVDARTDVYALGAVLFHALTGRPPFVGENEASTLLAQVNSPAPRVSEVRPDLPVGLDAVLTRALAKQPTTRFISSSELANAAAEALVPRRAAAIEVRPEQPASLAGARINLGASSATESAMPGRSGKVLAARPSDVTEPTAMPQPPAGNVTMLFTDIEGSTRLARQLGPRWAQAVGMHHAILRETIEGANGYVHSAEGDAVAGFFESPGDALAAAVEAQGALATATWPEDCGGLRVRMGLHTGLVRRVETGYVGVAIHLAARVCAAASGGQVLATEATRACVDEGFLFEDVGEHGLKDFPEPRRLFHLVIDGRRAAEFPSLRTAIERSNLPVEVSSFIGREHELEELGELLGSARLVTLVGSGGAGKTRLALQLARQLLEDKPDGVWFVDLAPLAPASDADVVAAAVASPLRIPEEPQRPIQATLLRGVGAQSLLVLLDNCEHVIEGVSEVAAELLRSCPHVVLLATSREPLTLSGEHIHRVRSLGVPEEGASDPRDVANSEAVCLFMERARQQRPELVLSGSNAEVIAEICRRLDGIPFAIELAAARLRSLSPVQLDARLDERFRVLKSTFRDAAPRQRTLQTLIDWSWDLLTDAEQSVLSRLSAFAGGFDLAAAEAVAGDNNRKVFDIDELVSSLVDKSLLQADQSDGIDRYRLLESVREYCAGMLAKAGEVDAARRAHRDHYLAVTESAAAHFNRPDAKQWLDRLDLDHDNLRAAILTCLDDPDPTPGLRLVSALRRFWNTRGHAREGVEAAVMLLDREAAPARTIDRAKALNTVAFLSPRWLGDYSLGEPRAEESLAIASELDDDETVCDALWNLAWLRCRTGDNVGALALLENALSVAQPDGPRDVVAALLGQRAIVNEELGDNDAARADHEESLRLFRQVGDMERVAAQAGNLANLAITQRDLITARARLEESVAITRDLRNHKMNTISTFNLGLVDYLEDNPRGARSLFRDSLTTASRLGNPENVGDALLGLALASSALGDLYRAATLHGAADACYEQLGVEIEQVEAELRDVDYQRLRSAMGEVEFQRAVATGRQMTTAEAQSLTEPDRVPRS